VSTTTRAAYAGGGLANAPGLPTGQSIATYERYVDAQAAVDHLSDQQFPVQHLSIVGTDLKQVERVTGRLTWGRVILSGALGGLWIGLFVGLLFALFTTEDTLQILLFCILWAVVFGIVFAAVGYALSGGRRDFTSLTATVASRYEIFCQHQHAAQARQLLAQLSLRGTGTITPEPLPETSAPGTGTAAGTSPTGTAAPQPAPPQPDLPGTGQPSPAAPTPAAPATPTPLDPTTPAEPPQDPRPPATA
jgi:hypothetical protein